jgi:hypothetical protein
MQKEKKLVTSPISRETNLPKVAELSLNKTYLKPIDKTLPELIESVRRQSDDLLISSRSKNHLQ